MNEEVFIMLALFKSHNNLFRQNNLTPNFHTNRTSTFLSPRTNQTTII